MAWTSPRTWVAGEKPSASTMNTHIRDNLRAIGDAWASYTPTWTAASVNPTLGNGSITGNYMSAGKLTFYRIKVTFGSTTAAGTGAYSFGLPTAAIELRMPCGAVTAFDNSGSTTDTGQVSVIGSNTVAAYNNAGSRFSPTVPYTWANGDTIIIAGSYEAA